MNNPNLFELEKIKKVEKNIPISSKTYKEVFQTYASTFPCIYLLCLGTVKTLRETFNISIDYGDELKIYKYGFTNDLSRRIGEHSSNYEKLKNVNITLSTFHFIDSRYTREAEGDIREYCNTFEKNLVIDGYNELIVINKKQQEHIKKYYVHIGSKYVGATQELQNQIVKLKNKIKDAENDLILQHEINQRKLGEKDISELKDKLKLQSEINEKVELQNKIKVFENKLKAQTEIELKLQSEIDEKEKYKYKVEKNKIIFVIEKEKFEKQIVELQNEIKDAEIKLKLQHEINRRKCHFLWIFILLFFVFLKLLSLQESNLNSKNNF